MIKIEFPSENTRLAGAIGRALVEFAGLTAACSAASSGTQTWKEAVDAAFKRGEAPLSGDDLLAELAAEKQDGVLKELASTPESVISEPVQEVAPAEQAIATLDRHGVAFDERFCGKAAEPFYPTGPREGQWKKRKGVDAAAYDAWYASQRAPAAAAPTEFDASAAFGGTTEPAPHNVPTDGAAFMVWTSEMLAAGRLKQTDINEAWQSLCLTPAAIFPPKGPDEIARNVGNLYSVLSAAAGV